MKRVVVFILLLVAAALFLYPLAVVFMNSVKPINEIISSPLSPPFELKPENYVNAWKRLDLSRLIINTSLITAGSLAGIILLASMASYWCERYGTAYSRVLSGLLKLSMLIPFASLMLPLVKVASMLRLNNSIPGTIIIYWGTGLAFAFFILRGCVKGIPIELEEAARIDGCGPIRTFWRIVFPLMRTGIVSVAVMDLFWIWNDFMLPLILMSNSELNTIQLGINRLFGAYSGEWDIALAALSISMIPIIIVFILLQKSIMKGVMDGAVKG